MRLGAREAGLERFGTQHVERRRKKRRKQNGLRIAILELL